MVTHWINTNEYISNNVLNLDLEYTLSVRKLGSARDRYLEFSVWAVWGNSPQGPKVDTEGGALLGRLQGALRGGAAAASPSRVASSIKGYLTNKVGSLQLKDTGNLF